MILDAGSSFMTTELMPYTATAGSATYVTSAAVKDDKAKKANPDADNAETIKSIRNTLITTATSTASALAHNVMYEDAITEAQALTQVEAQAYVDSLSDEELEQALTQVGLLEEDMSFDTEKTI